MENTYSPITPKKSAVLVDLSFFIKAYQKSQGKISPEDFAKRLKDYLFKTLAIYGDTIHRFYVYDCEPIPEGRTMKPISKEQIIFKDTPIYQFRKKLLEELKRQPLFAIRLGKLSGKVEWKLKQNIQKELLNKKKLWKN